MFWMELVASQCALLKIWAVPHQAYGSAFLFFLVFFSDNFNFKILINYSKASVIVLPRKQAQE